MRRPVVVLILFLLPTWLFSHSVHAGDLHSEKSARIIAKVRPRLERSLNRKGLEYGSPVFMRIFKKSKKLEIWVQNGDEEFIKFKSYRICKQSGGLGPKLSLGDRQSPEGFYTITKRQLNPSSRYHLAINVGYPNDFDKANNRTGYAIMLHGSCGSRGCFAMTDRRIEEIYTLAHAAFQHGQEDISLHIYPFKMTDKEMWKYRGSIWNNFWASLKEGYDFFEMNRVPPKVSIRDRRYYILTDKDLAVIGTRTNNFVSTALPSTAAPRRTY